MLMLGLLKFSHQKDDSTFANRDRSNILDIFESIALLTNQRVHKEILNTKQWN